MYLEDRDMFAALRQAAPYVWHMHFSDSNRCCCLLYTSDAADERSSVDLGGRRIIKKKKQLHHHGDARHYTIKEGHTQRL